ncbi:hypothetical protein A2U01_0045032, partial [Trifolium medium]|nr:hypothetical protein [Trifolium medium]
MPPRKVSPTEFKKMEAKVTALEGEISEVKSTLLDVQNAVKASHESLMAMFERCLGKTVIEGEGSANLTMRRASEERTTLVKEVTSGS